MRESTVGQLGYRRRNLTRKPQANMSRASDKYHHLNSVRNSDKLNNPAAPSSGEFFSDTTGSADILIFIVLRVLLQFLFHVLCWIVIRDRSGHSTIISHGLPQKLTVTVTDLECQKLFER